MLALYNNNGLVAPRLCLYNFWFQFTRFLVLVSSLQFFRTPCAWQEGYSTSLQGHGKTRPRRTLDLPTRKRTHLPLDHGLVNPWSHHPRLSRFAFAKAYRAIAHAVRSINESTLHSRNPQWGKKACSRYNSKTRNLNLQSFILVSKWLNEFLFPANYTVKVTSFLAQVIC